MNQNYDYNKNITTSNTGKNLLIPPEVSATQNYKLTIYAA